VRRELRRDPFTGAWVALCEGHVHVAPLARPAPTAADGCPLCSREGAQVLGERGEAWARPHRVPVVAVEEGFDGHADGAGYVRPGLGAHEVLVESRGHEPLVARPVAPSIDALLLARARHADLRGDGRLRWVGWSRTVGMGQLEHPHAELVALPVVPAGIERITALAARQPQLLGAVIDAEERRQRRWLAVHGDAVAWAASAPSAPFQVRVAHRHGATTWLAASDEALADVATLAWAVGRALVDALGTAAGRVELVQGPHDAPRLALWHLLLTPSTEVAPRSLAGGVAAHPGFPEEVAERLRPLCHDALQEAVVAR